jgi:hypothetical protein
MSPFRRTKKTKGKMSASLSAFKTGAYSNQEVLQGENLHDFLELKKFIIEDYSPQGLAEFDLVYDLAVLAWKNYA